VSTSIHHLHGPWPVLLHRSEMYGLDDDGYCLIANPDVPPGLEDQARRGAAAYPVAAMTVEE
jgi:hypothetical protein